MAVFLAGDAAASITGAAIPSMAAGPRIDRRTRPRRPCRSSMSRNNVTDRTARRRRASRPWPDRAGAAGGRSARRLPGRRLPGAPRSRHRARLGHRHLDRRDQCQNDRRQPAGESAGAPEGILGAHEHTGHRSELRPSPAGVPGRRWRTGRRMGGVQGFFQPNPLAFLGTQFRSAPETAGYYSTAPLETTLHDLVDPSARALHSRGSRSARRMSIPPRCTISTAGTARLRSGTSWRPALCRRPFRRCGSTANSTGTAAFSPTRRSRRYSTTIRGVAASIFAVNIWNPDGPEPDDMEGAEPPEGRAVFEPGASHIRRQKQIHRLRHVITELARKLPAEMRGTRRSATRRLWLPDGDACRAVAGAGLVREDHTKDIDFSPPASARAGRQDMPTRVRVLEQATLDPSVRSDRGLHPA